MDRVDGVEGVDFGSLVEEGRVRTDVYTSPAVFDAEMARIFGRAWVYVGHTSEITEPGDYKTTSIGTEPVILSRDNAGEVHVLFNRCRHRGTAVCQRERGNARYFRCAYHGWTYEADGRLIGVTYPSGYGTSFKREEMGLLEAPRIGIYRGFVWASLAQEGPSLEAHLGAAKEYLDEICDVSPVGEIELTAGSQRFGYDGNWKLQMENGVDGYHPNFVHQSFAIIMKEVLGDRMKVDFTTTYGDDSPAVSRDLGNGHGVIDQRVFAPTSADERSGGGFIMSVFPNLILLFGAQVRTIRPIAADRTEVTVEPVMLKGLPELTERRLRAHEWFFGPAGFGQPDDTEMFARIRRGLRAKSVEWIHLSRGLFRERTEGGTRVGPILDEVGPRAFYRMWKRLMTEAALNPAAARARGR